MTDLEIARAALQTVIDKTTPIMVIYQVCAKALEDTKPKPRPTITAAMVRQLAFDAQDTHMRAVRALQLADGDMLDAFDILKTMR